MSDGSAIQWTDATWNPGIFGCKEVSPGCAHCYAAVMAKRLGAMGQVRYAGLTRDVPAGGVAWTGEVRTLTEQKLLDKPRHWKEPRRIFVNSMSDLFHEDVPAQFILRVWKVMRDTPQHTYQILTKRPERMQEIVSQISWASPTQAERAAGAWGEQPYIGPPGSRVLPNVWLGTSVENQDAADERIPHVLATPAAVRFISAEPLLANIDLRGAALDWVICGGESGPRARRFDVTWAYSLRDQCRANGTAFFLKQLGANVSSMPVGYVLRDSHGGVETEWPEPLRGQRAYPDQEAADYSVATKKTGAAQ